MGDVAAIESNPVVEAAPQAAPRVSSRPPPPTTWQLVRKNVYDPETRKFFGRTATSWAAIGTYYLVFYGVLAVIIGISGKVLLLTLSDTEPKWKLGESSIGTSPGLGFRPISFENGALIMYNDRQPDKWVRLLDEFLEPYGRHAAGENVQRCDFTTKPKKDSVCLVEVTNFGPCGSEYSYGYNTSSPCVFIKLNKIFGWIPQVYAKPVPGMPSSLAETIEKSPRRHRNQVWVSCHGEDPVDKENVQEFRYYPRIGFPSYYYPYLNLKNYLSPLVAVHIINPTPNVLINIECLAWAKNIHHNKSAFGKEGSVHFEILYEKN